jgi:hypothetical protein
MWQSEREVVAKYTVDTLDTIIVSAGGFISFIMVVWRVTFGWYSAYRYESSLGNDLYQAEKKLRKSE